MEIGVERARTTSRAPPTLLLVCAVLAVALCVWGAVGWRRAYRAQAEADQVTWTEGFRDAQLLRVVVRGGEAVAQMALEGASEPAQRTVENECAPASIARPLDDGERQAALRSVQ